MTKAPRPTITVIKILNHIKSTKKFDETKVIIATADSIVAKTLENKSELVLIKPVSRRQLRDRATRLHPDLA